MVGATFKVPGSIPGRVVTVKTNKRNKQILMFQIFMMMICIEFWYDMDMIQMDLYGFEQNTIFRFQNFVKYTKYIFESHVT